MKQNIDLTLNRDFRKNQPGPIRIRPGENRSGVLPAPVFNDSIKESELNTNFLVGSFSRIRDKTYQLEIMRSISDIESGCDRCGGYLYIKTNTLCDRCDNEMEEEFITDQVMALLRS